MDEYPRMDNWWRVAIFLSLCIGLGGIEGKLGKIVVLLEAMNK